MSDGIERKQNKFVERMREYVQSCRWNVKIVPSQESELLDKITECLNYMGKNKQKIRRLKEYIAQMRPKHRHDHDYFHADCSLCNAEKLEYEQMQQALETTEFDTPARLDNGQPWPGQKGF